MKTVMKTMRFTALGLLGLAVLSPAWGQGNVTFSTDRPATNYSQQALKAAGSKSPAFVTLATTAEPLPATDKNWTPAPGTIRVIMSPVTLEQARKSSAERTFPADLIQGDTASAKPKLSRAARSLGGDAYPLGPASISELARSLRNNVDLIYQYLRNNVEYYPIWGVQKGALGTVLDNAGTDFDQSALMVELLRASGYTVSYVRGVITLNAQQFKEWYGFDTSNVCAVLGMLGQSQIPVASINATSAGSCPSLNAAMTDVSIEHVWVKVNIDGTNYVFDPSYKPHTLVEGIDVAAASGYNAPTFLSTAKSGAAITPDYVQNLNRSGIQSALRKS